MGFNTVALILNDQIHEAETDATFGRQTRDAVSAWFGSGRRDRFTLETRRGGLRVISQAHADHNQVVVVGQNCGRALTAGDKPLPGDLETLATILRDHGWKVTKPRLVKAPPPSPAA